MKTKRVWNCIFSPREPANIRDEVREADSRFESQASQALHFFCICFAVLGRKRPRVEPALCLQNKENPANVSQLKTAIHIHFVGKAKEKRSDLVALGLMQHCFSIFGF